MIFLKANPELNLRRSNGGELHHPMCRTSELDRICQQMAKESDITL